MAHRSLTGLPAERQSRRSIGNARGRVRRVGFERHDREAPDVAGDLGAGGIDFVNTPVIGHARLEHVHVVVHRGGHRNLEVRSRQLRGGPEVDVVRQGIDAGGPLEEGIRHIQSLVGGLGALSLEQGLGVPDERGAVLARDDHGGIADAGAGPANVQAVAAAAFFQEAFEVVLLACHQGHGGRLLTASLPHSATPVQPATWQIIVALAAVSSVLSHSWQLSSPATQKVYSPDSGGVT